MRDYVLLYINGQAVTVRGEKTRMMLADFLRYERRLTGTKIVCAEGDCGACSVLRCSPLQVDAGFVTINSCIATVAQMDGCSLVTVEGLSSVDCSSQGSRATRLHPVQDAMIECHGSQCGFCTPGFVVAGAGLVEKKLQTCSSNNMHAAITEREAKNYLTGNLCRCTGYQPIIEAMSKVDLKSCESLSLRYWTPEISERLQKHVQSSLWIQQLSGEQPWIYFAPVTAKEAEEYLQQQKDVKIVAAGTDFGVLVNKEKMEPTHWLSLHLVRDLYQVKIESQNKVYVGARVTLAEMRRAIENIVPEFSRFLDLFASPQIKNAATLVGNVANASPIADTPAFLMIAGAELLVSGSHGSRLIPMDQFYLGYRKTALQSNEMITGIRFDIPDKNEIIRLRKSSQRKDLDISCVNLGLRLRLQQNTIADLRLSLGGVAATPLRLKKTEASMVGQVWDHGLLKQLVQSVQSEINPISDLRGSSQFRRLLITNLLTQIHQEILAELPSGPLPPRGSQNSATGHANGGQP